MPEKEKIIVDAQAVFARLSRYFDATNLKVDCTVEDIMALTDEAMAADYASVCIAPAFVKEAVAYVKSNCHKDGKRQVPICTVIGFPLGYTDTASKVAEIQNAIANGADELDVVANIAHVKQGAWHAVEAELAQLRQACPGKILKLIIECCYLNEAEKIKLCELTSKYHFDFIKTSTGFASGGATVADVKLMKEHVTGDVKVKASGKIRDLATAEALVQAGAERLGLSAPSNLLKTN